MKLHLLMTTIFFSLTSFAGVKKALDGNAAACSPQLREFDKVLTLKVLEMNLLEDTAELDVQVSVVEDACSQDKLDVAPATAGSLHIQKYTLTATLPNGQLLFSSDLDEILEKSTQNLTIGLPKKIATEKRTIEIGIQVQGIDSQTIESLNPIQKNFGVFLFKF